MNELSKNELTKEELIVLNEERKRDLDKLIQHRKNNGYVFEESMNRELLLILANSLAHRTKKEAQISIIEVLKITECGSKNFILDLLNKKIGSFCSYFSAFGKNKYKYSNETIIDRLSITEEEMRELELETLITDKIKDERERELLEKIHIEQQIEESEKNYKLSEELLNYRDEALRDVEEDSTEVFPEIPQEEIEDDPFADFGSPIPLDSLDEQYQNLSDELPL